MLGRRQSAIVAPKSLLHRTFLYELNEFLCDRAVEINCFRKLLLLDEFTVGMRYVN
jgi:hypothetical protein